MGQEREKEALQRRLEVARQEATFEVHLRKVFGERHAEFSKALRDNLRELWRLALHTDVPTARETGARETGIREEQGSPAARSRPPYAATVGKWVPEHGPAAQRDVTCPPCPSCGGRGLGDYPFACNACGGSGNA